MSYPSSMPRELYYKAEKANTVSHAIGIVFAVLGTIALLIICVKWQNLPITISCLIYGLSLIAMYTASTNYHRTHDKEKKYRARIFDHSAIYLLIAGSYTPFCVMVLPQPLGYIYLAIIWGIAIVGIGLKFFFVEKLPALSIIAYIIMGWLIILVSPQLFPRMTLTQNVLLIAGGVLYSGGTISYAFKKNLYRHLIWHIFVFAASVCHYICILLYVIPAL